MIVREYLMTRSDGVKLYKTYSDSGKLILQVQTNVKYAEAIDVEDTKYVYVETDELIEEEETNEE